MVADRPQTGMCDPSAAEGAGGMANRSGSDKRQRTKGYSLRLSDDEHAEALERSQKAGLSLSAYFRAAALGDAGPRARKRAPVDRSELLRLRGELNRVGNNLNQIARTLNARPEHHPYDLDDALHELNKTIAAIAAVLGQEPSILQRGDASPS
jgi:hypothetical protein